MDLGIADVNEGMLSLPKMLEPEAGGALQPAQQGKETKDVSAVGTEGIEPPTSCL
jgi:hypothetical protein